MVLGDWGVAGWRGKHLCKTIQPILLRAPEVIIKAPWDTSTDWWNLGAVLFEVYCAIYMFDAGIPDNDSTASSGGRDRRLVYDVRKHLAKITDFFGPFPRSLLGKGDSEMAERIFSSDGTVRGYQLDRPVLASEEVMPRLTEEGREKCASFLRFPMRIDSDEKPFPEDILRHVWLDAIRKE